MATKLQIRRDTAANWTSANPTLSAGEFGFETDTYKLKIGDGSTAWNSLNYYDDQFSGLDSADTIHLLGLGVVKHIIPAGNELYDLGDSDNRFRDLYLSGNTLKLGDATLTAANATLQLPATVQIGTTTLTSTSTQSISIGEDSDAGTILDSASVLQLINAAYIQANQITYNTNDFADSAFVTSQINSLIDGAPGTLNTLNEIAAALNDDAAAYDTLLSLINAKTDYDSADTLGLIDSAYIQARQSSVGSSGVDSAAVTSLIDSAYIQARQTSGGSGTVDSAQVVSIINNNTNSGFVWYSYTATQGQTTFQDSDNSGKVLSYDPDGIAVFYNGVLLTPNDFTASDQSSVVLGTAADSGENIAVFKWGVGYTPPAFSWGGDRGVWSGGNSYNIMDYVDITSPGNANDFGDLSTTRVGPTGLGNGTYGLTAGGFSGAYLSSIDYVTVATAANAQDFGDMSYGTYRPAGASDGTYGLVSGGSTSGGIVNNIDYVIVATPGNGTDFGDLTSITQSGSMAANNTYALSAGGDASSGGSNILNIISYVTTATPSNATDFGDLTESKYGLGALSDVTYAVFAGGYVGGIGRVTTMDYVTIATPGNATDFGDLVAIGDYGAGCSNGTYGCWGGFNGQNVIQYITIASPSNATDFGDLTQAREQLGSFSGSPS